MKKYLQYIKESYGSSVFTSFSKCLTALGFKENSHSKDIPNDFLIFYKLDHTDSSTVKSIFSRFKSLDNIDLGNSKTCSLYFGIKCDNTFEYGTYIHEFYPIGSFKINNSKINSIKLSQLKSLTSLKKDLVDITSNDIFTLNKIKLDMIKFNKIKFQKREFIPIENKIIGIKFYGMGKWVDGNIDPTSSNEIKKIFKDYISNSKWSDKILINIKSSNFWTNIYIKLK